MGTFLDGLKPWLAKEVKLKQPARLQEAMRVAEILDRSYGMEKKVTKESFNDKASTSLPPNGPWKGKEEGEKNKERPQHIKKFSREELQDYIKRELCFKCGGKWRPGHPCKTSQAFLLDVCSEGEEVAIGATEEKGGEDQDYGADFSPSGDASYFALVMTEHQEGKEEATTKAPPPPPYMTLEDKGNFQGRGDVEDPAPPPQILAVTSEANPAQGQHWGQPQHLEAWPSLGQALGPPAQPFAGLTKHLWRVSGHQWRRTAIRMRTLAHARPPHTRPTCSCLRARAHPPKHSRPVWARLHACAYAHRSTGRTRPSAVHARTRPSALPRMPTHGHIEDLRMRRHPWRATGHGDLLESQVKPSPSHPLPPSLSLPRQS